MTLQFLTTDNIRRHELKAAREHLIAVMMTYSATTDEYKDLSSLIEKIEHMLGVK